MGKTKNKRHKAPKMQPTGMPSGQDCDMEMDSSDEREQQEPINGTVLSIIEKVRPSLYSLFESRSR